MNKKKKTSKVDSSPSTWIKYDEMKLNGRILKRGTEFSVKGEKGRFRFIAHVVTDKTEWIDCVGGQKGYEMLRAFSPSRVRRVHVKQMTRLNARKSEQT